MRKIDQYFYPQPTVPLHHYTGIGTLLSLASQPVDKEQSVLWAGHVSYLNDSQEIRHAKEAMRFVLKQWASIAENYLWFHNMFSSWLDATLSKPFDMFVFSLSEHQSLLSQWRSYTPHGKGVSITFSTDLVREIARKNHLKIGKCIYKKQEQLDLIQSLIDNLWVTHLRKGGVLDNETAAHAFFNVFLEDILQVLALIKHESFQEEAEWRLISNAGMLAPEVHFRQPEGALLLTPYTELKLPIREHLFDKITLGPTPHKELSLAALDAFATKSKLTLNIVESEIPYRKW